MWKHILIQGLYQMFWLFFFMYAAPVLFDRYHITDQCTFATTGSSESSPVPGFCSDQLVSNLQFSAQQADLYCSTMTSCGYSQHCGDAKRNTADCLLNQYTPPGQKLPGNAADAFAMAFPTNSSCPGWDKCPTIDDYNKAVAYFDKAYFHESELDWEKADSVLFNAFIWLQMLNEINARRINDELNVFEGIHRSPIFIGVILVTAVLQVRGRQTAGYGC